MAPTALQCDSPNVVTRKYLPNVLDMGAAYATDGTNLKLRPRYHLKFSARETKRAIATDSGILHNDTA